MESSSLLSPNRRITSLALLPILVIAPVTAAAAAELPIAAHWIGPETPVSAASGVLASAPDVAATTDGHALVVWQQAERYAPATTRALARLRRPDGSWGDVFVLADGPLRQPPTVTAVGPHAFVVTWADADGAGVRIVDTDGAARSRVTLRSELGGATALWRALLVPPGHLLATWRERVPLPGKGQEVALRVRAYGRFGKPHGPGVAFDQGFIGSLGSYLQDSMDLASNGMTAVAAWDATTCFIDGPGGTFCLAYGAQGAQLGLDGTVLGTFPLPYRSFDTLQPAVATWPGGRFVVALTAFPAYLSGEPGPDGDGSAIVARILDRDGNPASDELLVNTTAAGYQTSPAVAVDSSEGFLVVWAGDRPRGQAFDHAGSRRGAEVVATTGERSIVGGLAAVGAADYLVANAEQVAGDANGLDQRITVQQVRLAPARLNLSSDLVGTDEDGAPGSFDVSLPFAPSAPAFLELVVEPADAARVEPDHLTFTVDDWDVPRTITVRGRDDERLAGDVSAAVITRPLESDDPGFSGYDPPDVRVLRRGEAPCTAGILDSVGSPYWATGKAAAIDRYTSGEGCGPADLTLLRGEQPVAVIAEALPPTQGQVRRVIYRPPSGLVLAPDYRVRLTMPSRPALVAYSEPFWAGPAIACATGVATPRQGQQWQRGRPHRIRWKATGSCAGRRLRVLLDGNELARLPSTQRSYLWQVPANLGLGDHYLVLVDADDPRARSLPRYFQVTP